MNDRDTIRISFLVTQDQADKISQSATDYAKEGYYLIDHNCVCATGKGIEVAGLDKFLSPDPALFQSSYDTRDICTHIANPSQVYTAILNKIHELTRPPELIPTSDVTQLLQDVKSQTPMVNLAPDEPRAFSIFNLSDSLTKSMLLLPLDVMPMIAPRGNFGGIVLSKRASLALDLSEIYGVLFDYATSELVLVGARRIVLPEMRLDDLAVAFKSIYGLNGNMPQDPGISIDAVKPDGQMDVRYFGQTYGTEFGKVLFDGDLTLKFLVCGEYPCSIPGFLSLPELFWRNASDLPKCNARTWIIPEQISLTQSMDGSAMVFNETKMRCSSATRLSDGNNLSNVYADQFADFFTEHYDEISQEYPIFAEVKRLGQITGVVKWLKDNQIPIETSFFTAYIPKAVETPKTVTAISRMLTHNKDWLNFSGGILYYLSQKNFLTNADSSVDRFKQEVIESRPVDQPLNWEYQNLSVQSFPLCHTRKTGDLRTSTIDLEITRTSEHVPVVVRYYDSFDDEDRGFGRGWSVFPYQIYVPDQKNPPYLILREENTQWIYYLERGVYFREDGLQKLVPHHNGDWSLDLPNDQIVYFSKSKLDSFALSDGRKARYIYNDDGKVTDIYFISPNGSGNVSFTYSEDRIIEASLRNGKTAFYEYDDNRCLVNVLHKDPLPKIILDPVLREIHSRSDWNHSPMKEPVLEKKLKMSYSYDSDNRLIQMAFPDGKVLFRGSYDDYNRLISEHWNISFSEE